MPIRNRDLVLGAALAVGSLAVIGVGEQMNKSSNASPVVEQTSITESTTSTTTFNDLNPDIKACVKFYRLQIFFNDYNPTTASASATADAIHRLDEVDTAARDTSGPVSTTMLSSDATIRQMVFKNKPFDSRVWADAFTAALHECLDTPGVADQLKR